MIFYMVNAVVWGVLATVLGFNAMKHWEAWLIIITGVFMALWGREDFRK